MNEINYTRGMWAEMNDRNIYYAQSENYIDLSQETIDRLVSMLPHITITLEKDHDKLSPKKSLVRMEF